MMAITVTFQDLTSTSMYSVVEVAPSGRKWTSLAYPVSGWQQGQNPSGDVSIPVSGYATYTATVFPSGSMQTTPFSSDATIALAVFTSKN